MGKRKGSNPKAQRANVMNPNNPTFQAAQDNRANQLNPNNPRFSRGKKK
ncbi:MAG: hypothetical protein ACFFFH_19295 [Candidatus Thorarchaeota archaeon]